ncbi:MAG: esterase-like activity of phytase family protein, partial [Chromatiales bacterium]
MRSVLLVACLLALTSSGARTEPIGAPVEISDRYHAGDRFMRVRLLGTVRLRNTPVAGFAASELSGIAWDEDERTLYAVSDAGHVVHLRPHFAGEVLTGTDLLATYPLRDEEGFVLREQFRDAEGLAIRHGDNDKPGDAELVVSFERRPRLAVYRADGTWIRSAPVPEVLHRRKHYAGDNSQLEAVTWTESVGIVVAPQKPLKSAPRNLHGLYDETGRVWTFPAIDPVDSSLVGLETAPDGSVL